MKAAVAAVSLDSKVGAAAEVSADVAEVNRVVVEVEAVAATVVSSDLAAVSVDLVNTAVADLAAAGCQKPLCNNNNRDNLENHTPTPG